MKQKEEESGGSRGKSSGRLGAEDTQVKKDCSKKGKEGGEDTCGEERRRVCCFDDGRARLDEGRREEG